MVESIRIILERSPKKVFATAADWPGWSRSGRADADALDALASYATRYAAVVARADAAAGDEFAAVVAAARPPFTVVDEVEGSSGTAFGVPSQVAPSDCEALDAGEAERRAALVAAAWAAFDDVVRGAPGELRKGPRGGGRDTAKIVDHVVGADHAYAREIGLRLPFPDPFNRAAVRALRAAMLEVLRQPSDGSPLAGRRWTTRYAAQRIAWHALDHAWEIEDRSEVG